MKRKNRRAANRPVQGFLLAFAVLFLLVWPRNLLVRQGYRKQQAEMLYRELLSENEWLEARLIRLKNAGEIRARVREFGLGLAEPEQWNVYFLSRPAPETPAGVVTDYPEQEPPGGQR